MTVKQHHNGDVTYWFEGKCYAIKFAGSVRIYYFVRYEKGRMKARLMTAGAFNCWYYSKHTSGVWDVRGYCNAEEFDCEKQEEMIKYINGGVL